VSDNRGSDVAAVSAHDGACAGSAKAVPSVCALEVPFSTDWGGEGRDGDGEAGAAEGGGEG